METCGSTSGPDRTFESGPENGDDSIENEFHFGYLTVETSAYMRAARRPLATSDELTVLQKDSDVGGVPTFYETIPSLQEMSSLIVAISSWRRVLSLQHNSNYDSVTKIDQQEVENILLQLPLPRLICEIVRIYSARVACEMEDWLRYYKLNLFTSKRGSGEGTINTGDLLFCCWLPDGKIDHRESALNMLTNPRLSQVDKFKIMCRYCLADEVKKSSAQSLPSYFTKRIHFSKNALMYYWLCYMKGDLDKIPKRNGESVESHLITVFNVDTWSAIEYFWHRLNEPEQTSKIEQLLNQRPEFQKYVFSKMTEFQKFHIFSKIPIKIMENFWKKPGQVRFALETWAYIRNFVDYEQFKEIMKTLTWENSSRTEEKIKCLVDIWNICPDRLKNLAIQPAFMDIIINFHPYGYYRTPCDNIELLLAYLSHFGAEQRKKILFERANMLVLRIDESATDELIKLCLPDSKDVVEFRKHVLESNFIQRHLRDELHENNFEILYRFLYYYGTDAITRSEICCKILESFAVRGRPFYDADKWINVVRFIDENVLQPDKALKFKKSLASSFADFCCELWSDNDDMVEMMQVVSQVLEAEELAAFKENALERVQTRYRWGAFDENVIGEFLSWCCNNDDQKVREFIKSLSIDRIFEYAWHSLKWNSALKTDIDQEKLREFFAPLNKCLLWYFQDVEEVKKFKLEKVFAYCDKGHSMFLQYLNDSNSVFTKITLPWFFEGDRDAIELFK